MVSAVGNRGRGQVKSVWVRAGLGLAPLFLALPLGCSSTGVGNPVTETGTLSLAIVSDDDLDDAATTPTTLGTADTTPDSPQPSDVVEPLPHGALERAVIVI